MKYSVIILISTFLIVGCSSESKKEAPSTTATTFIFVRHAEKETDGSKDPVLSSEGTIRAERLAGLFTQQNISALYATPYQRTQLTLGPLANAKNLTITTYQPNEDGFLASLLQTYPNGTVVIAGHSNTIPTLVNELVGEQRFATLDESDYNDVFIVTGNELGKAKVIQLTY